MDAKQIANLDALGVEVVRAMYVVIDDGSDVHGLDDNGDPIVNMDKDGNIRDVFCVLAQKRAIKVYTASSQSELKSKLQAKTPDIERR